MSRFPFFQQPEQMDCGPTCLKMVSKYYGKTISLPKLRDLSETGKHGSNLYNLSNAAESIGFRSLGVKITYEVLKEEVTLPCIIHWREYHYIVVYKITKTKVSIADPAHGLIDLTIDEFTDSWLGKDNETNKEGIALLLEPTPKFYEDDTNSENKKGFSFLFRYLLPYKKIITQLGLGLLTGSLLQLIFPFLTQSIVDIGIQNQDIHFVYLILLAQLFLFFGKVGLEIIRGWILLHLSSRINISLVSDFFIKLMSLPISFFDSKMTGDIMQRINDHSRIENLLTNTSLNVLFSLFNLIIFGIVLSWYNLNIFLVFLLGSIIYFLWIILFLKKRKNLDYKRFTQLSDEKSKVIELINGMQDIKLHNAEKQKRWSWEFLQAKLYKIEIKNLALEQIQTIGSNIINELKNIIISILAAKLVIDGEITIGMMMAITYIIGQLNAPILQIISFVYTVQDAKIALERLSEIHNKDDEENQPTLNNKLEEINKDIVIDNISFRYKGAVNNVINGVSLTIPYQKTTAIVGTSGSGKTTLLKLLLKFYEPNSGEIRVGNINLNNISQYNWRSKCGVVMQDGYIFNDTIANNIAVGEQRIDEKKLLDSVEVANGRSFIEQLPLGYNTLVGMEGVGMSGGQKQRLLIARSVYKSPDIVFFDEATSSLDAENERIIIKNLDSFFEGRTAVIIAHRLSTVKNADQIVVLDQGKIVEIGTHRELVNLKGHYFNLVKNQLDL